MIGNSTTQTRLCPYCANSIAEDATDCPYCKADFASQVAPGWLKRDDPSAQAQNAADNRKHHPTPAIPAKFIWMGALLAVALIGFFAGGYVQRNRQSQTDLKQLQAKERMIQAQEAQLAQTRQDLSEKSRQLAETTTQLQTSQKDLSLAQQRLSAAARQAERANTSRSAPVGRTATRSANTAAPLPQPGATRRAAAPGVYQTTRSTALHEDPSTTSRVISQIEGGTRINVVSSAGGWLEVRSKRGNPPGYVRSDDARLIGGTS
jgi:multidrug efflux pump subunit AcrA (membrane-fusion protein)